MDEHTAWLRQPNSSIGQAFLWAFLPTLALLLIAPSVGDAQVVTTSITSTTGAGDLGTTVTHTGNLYDITGGTRPGNGPNLFHSFGEFSVGSNNIANFLNETATPTTNIFSRVTGGNPSNIFGTIQTTDFGAANLYLINPAGVIFGPTASLNVGGSFAASTADYLKMTDGAKFYADPAQTSVLSIAPVEAFGFLVAHPAPITIQESMLQVPTGKSLWIVGGNLTIVGGTLSAPDGEIRLASIASSGEVIPTTDDLDFGHPDFDTSSQLGQIHLSQALLDVSAVEATNRNSSGGVLLKGDQLIMDASSILGQNPGSEPGATLGAGIDIRVNSLVANGSNFSVNAGGSGASGAIAIQGSGDGTFPIAATITLNQTSLTAESALGSGGAIFLDARTIDLTNSTFSTSSGGGDSSFQGGVTNLFGQNISMNGGTVSSNTSGAARAGDIFISADNIVLSNGATISSASTGSGNAGNAGTITLRAPTGPGSGATSLSLDNSTITTTISGGSANNIPASIDITAQTVNLTNGAQIKADTGGAAPAGNITLNVDTLTAVGLHDLSRIDSSSNSSGNLVDYTRFGNAGTITIQGITGAGSPAAIVSLDHSDISTDIVGGTAATPPATITITAHTLALANSSSIDATTFVGAAPAGNITLNVETLTAGDSFITSQSNFSLEGNAGNITIQGVTGPGSPAAHVSLHNSHIGTEIFGRGTAANRAAITITAQTLDLTDQANIKADTHGEAPAGDITLNVDRLTVGLSENPPPPGYIDFLGISSRSSLVDPTAGKAGNITIQGIAGAGSPATDVRLDGRSISTGIEIFGISTEVLGGSETTTPGAITIAAHSVTLSDGGAITASTTGNAPAGNIDLITHQLTMTHDSAITSSASSERGGAGKAGAITITGAGSAPTTIAGGTIQAQSETSAIAGDITLHAPGDLTLLGTTVSVKNTGAGNAGLIDLRAGNDLLVKNSQVSTESVQASGGNIELTAPNLIHLVDSTLTSSVQGQAGSHGGNINIDPQFVVIQNSQLLANANAGAGGTITISATGAVLIDPNSLLSASAGPAGVSGSVNIIAPFQVLGGILVPLSQSFSQAGLSGDRCAADPTGQFSSFVQVGRDGVPQIPGALSPSPLSFLETLTSGSLGSPGPNWAAARLGLDSVSDPALFRFHSACRS